MTTGLPKDSENWTDDQWDAYWAAEDYREWQEEIQRCADNVQRRRDGNWGENMVALAEEMYAAVTSRNGPKPRDYIRLNRCQEGHLYVIHSRNLSYGVFRAESGGFIGIREKFSSLYLFEEYHYDNGPPFGTVRPYGDLGAIPADLEICEGRSDGSWWRQNDPLFEYLTEVEATRDWIVDVEPYAPSVARARREHLEWIEQYNEKKE